LELQFEVSTTYSIPVRLRCLATTEVAQSPGSIAEHTELTTIAKQSEQRLKGALLEDVVSTNRAITSNVAESPDSLFPDIWLRGEQKLDKDRYGACFNDNLCLLCRPRGDICQSPGSLELDKCVRRAEEFNESADNASSNDFFDGWVPLLG